MAKFNKIAVLLWVDMAITMVNIGVYAENRKNVDNLRKQIEKKSHQLKSYGQRPTKIFYEKRS